jgi:dipeptide/tripeptide permease
MNTGGNGVGLLAPMITPWIGVSLGWEWGLGVGAVVVIVGALCWCWIDPTQRGVEEQSELKS